MPADEVWIDAHPGHRAFDDPGHRSITEPLAPDAPGTVDLAEQGTSVGPGGGSPVRHRRHDVRQGMSTPDEADFPTAALLIGLALANRDAQALALFDDVFDMEADQLAPPHAAHEAHQQEGPISEATQIVGQGAPIIATSSATSMRRVCCGAVPSVRRTPVVVVRTSWVWVGESSPDILWPWLIADRRRVIVAGLKPDAARSAT
jgi:hypothetical protein